MSPNTNKRFYITTPIYYTNALPHVGNSYASLIADVYARAKRLVGYDVKFGTGTDEHGQKIATKAAEEGMDVHEFVTKIANQPKALRDELEISYTDRIRTSNPIHKAFVQKMLQKAYDKGDIYEGVYEGLYDLGDERFIKPEELTPDGLCPNNLKKPIHISEKNYFFELKKYQKPLEEFYEKNPNFVFPNFRYNEVKSFVAGGLEDFSISRETNKYGIQLPFDTEQVAYVRYDALLNYVTMCQPERNADQQAPRGLEYRPVDIHVLGKDISRFHAIYRPAMLMGLDILPPKREIVTGFFTVDGQKMSKSIGNVVDPVKLCRDFDRDALALYFLYDLKVGSDGDFSNERFVGLYEGMLIGGWGNLVNRVTKLSEKQNITAVSQASVDKFLHEFLALLPENPLAKLFSKGWDPEVVDAYLEAVDLQSLVRDRYELVQTANKCINDRAPWVSLKNPDTAPAAVAQLEFLLYVVKNLALLASPFLIHSYQRTCRMYGVEEFVWDQKAFPVNLKSEIVYVKKEVI